MKNQAQKDKAGKMKEKKTFLKDIRVKVLLVILILFCGIAIRSKLEDVYDKMHVQQKEESEKKTIGRDLGYAQNVSEDNKILKIFQEKHPAAEVLVACEEDLSNDGYKDLVVIYRPNPEKLPVELVIMVDSGNGEDYTMTEPISAPVENQRLQFKNIDGKDEMEFVLQGEKGNKVGYGIYRLSEGVLVNLFGEGMEEC